MAALYSVVPHASPPSAQTCCPSRHRVSVWVEACGIRVPRPRPLSHSARDGRIGRSVRAWLSSSHLEPQAIGLEPSTSEYCAGNSVYIECGTFLRLRTRARVRRLLLVSERCSCARQSISCWTRHIAPILVDVLCAWRYTLSRTGRISGSTYQCYQDLARGLVSLLRITTLLSRVRRSYRRLNRRTWRVHPNVHPCFR